MGASSRGRTAKTRGVNDHLLKSDSRTKHGNAGSAGTRVSAPTPEAMRSYLEALLCPFCGLGPYKMPLGHISLTHGLSGPEVREMAGLSLKATLTDAESHAKRSEWSRAQDSPEKARARARAAVERRAAHGRRQTTALKKASTASRNLARAAQSARANELKAEVREFWEGSSQTWSAIAELAEKFGLTRKSARSYVTGLGYAVEDGRTNTDLKRKPNEEKRSCEVAGCERVHTALGLCRYHWQQKRIQEGKVPTCSAELCARPIVARGLCSRHYDQQRAASRPMKPDDRP